MKKILVLGAGLVSRPLVRYLLDQPGYYVNMASRTASKAERIIDSHDRGEATALDVSDDSKLERLVSDCDIVVSLLPYMYHVKVARFCIKFRKHLLTTSYVSDEMRRLHGQAREAGVVLLNECGLDPGIDHMSAMRMIHGFKSKGGRVVSFRSTTGALPSHESNTNPFGYKFSWSPRGVLLASLNPARWLEDGREVSVSGERLFEHYSIQDVPGVGSFENYPNRDSMPYRDVYGLEDAETVYRGTFRMTGWCETMRDIVSLGWLSDEPVGGFSGGTYGDLTRTLVGAGSKDDLVRSTADFLGLSLYSAVIKRLEWLGLFSEESLPEGKDSPLDYLNVLTLKKMSLGEGERDMVVMHHEFIVEYPSEKVYVTSTLVDYGIPDGDSSVSRTVGLPAAIGVKMVLEGKIGVSGVHIPVVPEIYGPILGELEELGIGFSENIVVL